jgi:hypothetical protein
MIRGKRYAVLFVLASKLASAEAYEFGLVAFVVLSFELMWSIMTDNDCRFVLLLVLFCFCLFSG